MTIDIPDPVSLKAALDVSQRATAGHNAAQAAALFNLYTQLSMRLAEPLPQERISIELKAISPPSWRERIKQIFNP